MAQHARLAARRQVGAHDDPQQRGLAAARLPHDADHRAARIVRSMSRSTGRAGRTRRRRSDLYDGGLRHGVILSSMKENPALRIALRKRYGKFEALGGVDLESPPARRSAWSARTAPARPRSSSACSTSPRATPARSRFSARRPRGPARAAAPRLSSRALQPAALPARARVPRRDVRARGERYDAARRHAFRELELDRDVLEQPVRTLSKGMTQKLGLAGCFAVPRDLYVLDEPMSGLDPAAGRR